MYQNVLYALDINSKAHLIKAHAIAKQLGATFYVGYATDLGETLEDNEIYFGQQIGDAVSEEKQRQLNESIAQLLSGTEINEQQVHIVNGPVGMALDKLADKLGIDLVIVARNHQHFHLFIKPDTLIRITSHRDVLNLSQH